MATSRSVRLAAAVAGASVALLTASAFAGDILSVVSVHPPARTGLAAVGSPIVVDFDRPVRPDSVTSARFWAFGRWSGTASGTLGVSPDHLTVTLTPDEPFSAGESVMVILSHDLAAEDGTTLRSAGYSYQFWTRAQAADRQFELIDTMSTRTTPAVTSRAYGGIATDQNGDGFLDITIVNEDTADLRVFLSQADGSGLFDDFLQPTFPVGQQASPSEPADFNRDGVADICVANIAVNSVSILLGNGDGTFAPQQLVPVGTAPRGIAVLDVDGDGDVDIVNTNASSSQMSVLLNNGFGVFGPPTFFEGGGNGEWALAAADMTSDGILDLVIGARSGQQIIVSSGNGDGTFTFASTVSSGGNVWMLVCGDVNADGHEDVATVNSSTGNGAILLGNGAGSLAAPQLQSTDPFALATDLADLDGDGDLDWITSSFNGDWFVFTNDGTGAFAFDQEMLAPTAASCSLPMDFDNDGDLDLALIDELADVVMLMRNVGVPCPGDLDGSGTVNVFDLLLLLGNFGNTLPQDTTGDLTGPDPGDPADGVVNVFDLLLLLAAFGQPCPT